MGVFAIYVKCGLVGFQFWAWIESASLSLSHGFSLLNPWPLSLSHLTPHSQAPWPKLSSLPPLKAAPPPLMVVLSLGFSLLNPWPLSLSQAHGSLSLSPRLGQGHVMAVGFGGRLWVMEVVGMVGIWPWALVCEFWPWVLVVAVCLVIVGL
uniref:Uncharacterized protein n=1 Tax=Fagus sylvatica TaxID=28930 RepID=A0A2N9J6K2_FAGSY